jgi:rubrerythrin
MAKYLCMNCNYNFTKKSFSEICPNCGEKTVSEEISAEELVEESEL